MAVVVGLVIAAAAGAGVGAQGVAEPALKAAFLFNFVRFANWPEDLLAPTAPIVLCVTDVEMGSALENLVAGRTIDQHALTVKRVKLDGSARGCTALYAGKLDRRKAKDLLGVLQGTSVLTVGDAEDFATAGGMIGLFVDAGRMRFAINLDAVERSRLRLSAQVLSLAKIVRD